MWKEREPLNAGRFGGEEHLASSQTVCIKLLPSMRTNKTVKWMNHTVGKSVSRMRSFIYSRQLKEATGTEDVLFKCP